jgi:hypothetical protein
MLQVLLGAVVGILLVWLARSQHVREEARRRLPTVPESIRQAATSAKTASAGQLERVAQAFDATPISQPLRDTLGRATTAARSTAEKLVGASAAGHAAMIAVQELPNGSWVGDATWGGRTLSDGAPDPEVLIRRLATSLAAIMAWAGVPDAGRPERIKLTRVPQGGPREEREEELTALLG